MSRLLAAIVTLAALAAGGCNKKPAERRGPSPEVTGLAAVPSTAEVIIGIDVERLVESPLIVRAIEQLLSRERDLATRWGDLAKLCAAEVKEVHRAMIVLGPSPTGGKHGTGPMVLIATGKVSEPAIVRCVREVVGNGGGQVTVKNTEARTLYQVKDGARMMFAAFGRADTVVLGNDEAYVAEAVGAGAKALDQEDLARWLKQVDQHAPVWIVGRVSDRLKTGLIRASNNMLKAGPQAFLGTLDLTTGLKGDLTVHMASNEDAIQLESLANMNMTMLSWAAQAKSLGRQVQKITVAAEGREVRIKAALDMDDVNHLLAALDGGGAPAQDSPPPGGSQSPPSPPGPTPQGP